MDLDSRTTWIHPLVWQARPQDSHLGVLEVQNLLELLSAMLRQGMSQLLKIHGQIIREKLRGKVRDIHLPQQAGRL